MRAGRQERHGAVVAKGVSLPPSAEPGKYGWRAEICCVAPQVPRFPTSSRKFPEPGCHDRGLRPEPGNHRGARLHSPILEEQTGVGGEAPLHPQSSF